MQRGAAIIRPPRNRPVRSAALAFSAFFCASRARMPGPLAAKMTTRASATSARRTSDQAAASTPPSRRGRTRTARTPRPEAAACDGRESPPCQQRPAAARTPPARPGRRCRARTRQRTPRPAPPAPRSARGKQCVSGERGFMRQLRGDRRQPASERARQLRFSSLGLRIVLVPATWLAPYGVPPRASWSERARYTGCLPARSRGATAAPASSAAWLPATVHGRGRSEHRGGLADQGAGAHSAPRPSIKCLSGAAMLPNRVGLPSARPDAFDQVAART